MTPTVSAPESMPVLSRGKHRNPKRGACFMEMASFLAGERWSDHPACTHPLLAGLARLVNDNVTDRMRPQLVPMIPSVIGLSSDDLHLDAAVALRSAVEALPVAAESRQHLLATAILASERFVAGLDGTDPGTLCRQSREVLDLVPQAEAWARSFAIASPISGRAFRTHTAPHTLSIAVLSIAQAPVPDAEQRLINLLAASIADCEALVGAAAVSGHRAATDLP